MQQFPFVMEWPHISVISVVFVYVLLPLFLFVYYIVPPKARPVTLLAISLLFFALQQAWSLPIVLVTILLDYLAVRLMEKYEADSDMRGFWFGFSVAKNILVVALTGILSELMITPVFFGVVIYSLSSLSAVMSFYNRETPYERNIVHFILYAVFFPKLYAGPIQSYKEFRGQLTQVRFNFTGITLGIGQFAQGGLKVVLFGRQFFDLYTTVSSFPPQNFTVLSSWFVIIVFTLAIYFMLSGYCDIAQGIAAMFGFFLPKNFYYPYQARSAADFLNRFNITGIGLIRRLVYSSHYSDKEQSFIPPTSWPDFINLILCGMLIGLWFGIRTNFLVWGVLVILIVCAEQTLLKSFFKALPTLVCRLITLFFILISFVFMSGSSLAQSVNMLYTMFGGSGAAAANDLILFTISSNGLLLLAGAFLCTNILNRFVLFLYRHYVRVANTVMFIVNAAILVVFTAIIL